MDNIGSNKMQPIVRKVKKKQVKGEVDRLKQLDKKKRRLEKALATSAAAIRSELEKKKQKKKEEQQRLDEEGAAIAEAVALHVLLGEDSDDSCNIVLNEEQGFNPWNCTNNLNLLMGEQKSCFPHQDSSGNYVNGWLSNTYGNSCHRGEMENGAWPFSYGTLGSILPERWFEDGGWGSTECPAALIASHAVSSLQITEDAHVDTILYKRMLRGYLSWLCIYSWSF